MKKTEMERRLPSYPLFVKDPNFSIWMGNELLNEKNTETWFGEEKKIYGFLKTEGETYCFLGKAQDFSAFGVKPAEQTGLNVTAFTTEYTFTCGAATLYLRFVSPLPPNDLELMSLPVCYLQYEITGAEKAEISLFINREIAYNDTNRTVDKRVRGGVFSLNGFETSYLGLARQLPLSNAGDLIGADWGYYYLAGESAYLMDEKETFAYLLKDMTHCDAKEEEKYIVSINREKSGKFLVGYDEGLAIDYFGKYTKGYYLEKHTILDALNYVWNNLVGINETLDAFDRDLRRRAQWFGEEYIDVLYASLRQSVAAHKLILDEDGKIVFCSKECGSCGCIATVDVSYPSMPLFLLYNPELVKGMMRPIFKFARMPIWTYDFAPHDVGIYPACTGQVYGLEKLKTKYNKRFNDYGFGEYLQTLYPIYQLPSNYDVYEYTRQMPVEESADMLIMLYNVYRLDKDAEFVKANLDLCEKWVRYLVEYGLKPENQLCTDDFAGHLANNLNLSVKATIGIASYAELLRETGDESGFRQYREKAEAFAKEISDFAKGKTHLPITWDGDEDTFSLKYNFAFDKILNLGLFEQELYEKEVDYYLSKANEYGTPLDNRAVYTKSDWLMWVARLTDDAEKSKTVVRCINTFLKKSSDRVPFGDWYKSDSGNFIEFRARSVQGGCFILLL